MKTIVAAMITCMALFGLSMGATQFLLTSPDADAVPEHGETDGTETEDGDSQSDENADEETK